MKKLTVLLFSLTTIMLSPGSSYAWGDEHYCYMSDVFKGKCKAGDYVYLAGPKGVLEYCDLSKPHVVLNKDQSSSVICIFRGEKRGKR